MVVKMNKWSPWQQHPPPPITGSKKFRVKVERIKLEGFEHAGGGGDKVMGVELRWKGERKHGLSGVHFHRRRHGQRLCKERILREREVIVWEEEDDLENVCLFSMSASNGDEFEQQKFVPWILTFKLTYGEYTKGKMSKIGKASLDLAEFASKAASQVFEKKLPIDLAVAGLTTQATISVVLSFMEIRDSDERVSESTQWEGARVARPKKKQLSLEDLSMWDSDNSITFDSDGTSSEFSESRITPPSSSSSVAVHPEPEKKTRTFNWKRPRLHHKHVKPKAEDSRPEESGSSVQDYKTLMRNSFPSIWETREFISRDGESKLNSQSFFASFDQRGDKAAGPSACTALVTVIAHWLMSNGSTSTPLPTVQQFDTLIINGSSEWRTLCENNTHLDNFPDRHFDLETVLRARIRPVTVSREKSFVGFFSPEKFDSLTGVMSFDDIWDREISRNVGVYIVSWNDHFFVLKVEEDGYYIIDTLGERLGEGCEQAYILGFDSGSCLIETGTNQVICEGKECCREFMKRFLAAIPVKELESEEQKQGVPYYALHHRLQIEFNFCSMV